VTFDADGVLNIPYGVWYLRRASSADRITDPVLGDAVVEIDSCVIAPLAIRARAPRTAEESTTVEMWELVAREQIRDTLARYNWSGDAGRLDDLAGTFCADGVLEIRGFEPLRGRSEIVSFLGGVTSNVAVGGGVKPIVRHNVANLLFNELTQDHAQVSSYFTVVTHIGLDHIGRYRDTVVPDGDTWRIRHRKVSTDWAAPNSAMARGNPDS
jgi:hypothetical protein